MGAELERLTRFDGIHIIGHMITCTKCRSRLPPDLLALSSGGSPVKGRRKTCPYCGGRLEPRQWPYVLLVLGAFSVALAAKKVIGPLIPWEGVVIGVVLVLTHHLIWIVRRRRRRKKGPAGLE